jgi:hypothetical protein
VFGWSRILKFGVFAAVRRPKVRSGRTLGPIPNRFPLWCAVGVTTTVRILAIIYIAQAAAGIALGIVYAVWTMSRV